jgi:hypothetical protein
MRRNALAIPALLILLALLDQLYRVLHPEVNLVRASLVGATAWAALLLLRAAGLRLVPPGRGALAIGASAVGSVLLIQAGWLVSRSTTSAAVHVVILAAAFQALPRADGLFRPRTRSRESSPCAARRDSR